MGRKPTMATRVAGEMSDLPGSPRMMAHDPASPAAAALARVRGAQAQELPTGAPQPPQMRGEDRIRMDGEPRRPKQAGPSPAGPERAARQRSSDRKPFGTHEQALSAAPIPGYAQRWFNDTPARIERAKQAGWEHVHDPVTGAPTVRNVGRGEGNQQGLSAYLMKTPIEWYKEDQDEHQERLEERLSDIRNGQNQGENQYVGANHRIIQGVKR